MVKDGGTGIAYVNGVAVLTTGVVNPKVAGDSVFRFELIFYFCYIFNQWTHLK